MTLAATTPGLPPALSDALEAKGFETLTDVQRAMLEPELDGRDLLVSAQTGSGKTVAFGLAVGPDLLSGTDRLARADLPLALVVAPTRELAMQVARELRWLYAGAGAAVATCVGGMDMRDERQALARGAHIVVGTPGRLFDHISRRSLDLSDLRAVVLDEADEMLNMGFREELESILEACPQDRRTLMFSATVSGGIAKLAGRYQNDALRISVTTAARQHDDISYRAFVTAQHDHERAIINTLRFYEAENAIVFCSTRAAVARLASRFANRGFPLVSLSGELSQKERTNALQALRDGRARVCVATDVAARGIDLPGLELVIHADLPKNREGLLHRSGRTGRAGRKGTSVLIVPPRARRRVERLLQDAGVKAEWASPPSAEAVEAKDAERLLSDPALTEKAEINDLARAIAEQYSAEHLAAALVRMHQSSRSAPEELSEVAPPEAPRQRAPRTEIEDSVWIVLSVGKAKGAEPRWLLPMLCKSGPMPKGAIGAIRVRENETYVQLDAEGASGFLERMGNACRLEEGINVARADGPPPPERFQAFTPDAKKSFRKKSDPRSGKNDRAAAENKPHDHGGPGPKKGNRKPFAGKPTKGPRPNRTDGTPASGKNRSADGEATRKTFKRVKKRSS